jgi:hypothetical protein
MNLLVFFPLIAAVLLSNQLFAQARRPETVSEISTYMGADREQTLYAGAKHEGVINWYTSLAGDSYKALSRAFETKYPGVRVEAFRAGGSELTVRMSEEIKARRPSHGCARNTLRQHGSGAGKQFDRPYNSPLSRAIGRRKRKADAGLTF